MKITKTQLSKLIKEELHEELEEQKQETPEKQKKSMGDVLTLEKVLGRIDQTNEFGPAVQKMLRHIKKITDNTPGLRAKIRQALIDTAKEVASSK